MRLRYWIVLFALIAVGVVAASSPLRSERRLAIDGDRAHRNLTVDRHNDSWSGKSGSSSDDGSDDDSSEAEAIELAASKVFFEYNSTDLDLGLHLFFDGPGWSEMQIEGPGGMIFEVENGGGFDGLGSTEVFQESAEPPLDPDNLAAEFAAFQARFPEGEYEFEGRTIDGQPLEGSWVLSHALPAAPELVFPAEGNDEADPYDTVIEWIDTSGPGDPEIDRYEVIVEFEAEESGRVYKISAEIPADPDAAIQSLAVTPDFFGLLDEIEGEYKAEVVAIDDDTRNATIVELEFELED